MFKKVKVLTNQGMFMRLNLIIAASSIFITISASAQTKDCNVVLEDAFDTTFSYSEAKSSDAYRKFQCSSSFKNHDQVIGYGMDASILYQGVSLSSGSNFNATQTKQWKDESCSDEEKYANAATMAYEFTRKFSPVAANVAKACFQFLATEVKEDNVALRCTLLAESSLYKAEWRRTIGDESAPVVEQFLVKGGKCDNAPKVGDFINEGGTYAICKQSDGEDIAIILQTNRGSCANTVRFAPETKILSGTRSLTEDLVIDAERLVIASNTSIITNGFGISLSASRDIEIKGNPQIISFDKDGANNKREHDGRNAGNIFIQAPLITGTVLTLTNFGEDGLNGAKGSTGSPGKSGHGREMKWGSCKGKSGKRGGTGGRGLNGGHGGDAGDITIAVENGVDSSQFSRIRSVTERNVNGTPVSCNGSCGGLFGTSGDGGDGGAGGNGGQGKHGCGGTSGGSRGYSGSAGLNGTRGQDKAAAFF
jgi:hypothetical protein